MKFYLTFLLSALAGLCAKVNGSNAVDVSVSPDDVAIAADSKGMPLDTNVDHGMTPVINLRGAAAAMFPLSVEDDEEGACSGLGGCRKQGCSCGCDHPDGKLCCWPFGGACIATSEGMRCE